MGMGEEKSDGDGKLWSLCKMPFWQMSNGSSSSSNASMQQSHLGNQLEQGSGSLSSNGVSSVAKSLLPTRRRLRLDPPTKLYFPCMLLKTAFFSLEVIDQID